MHSNHGETDKHDGHGSARHSGAGHGTAAQETVRLGAAGHCAEQHGGGGHDQHAGHSTGMFRDRFCISLLLTLPVVIWSAHIEQLLGYTALRLPFSARIPAALGTLVFL